MASVILSALWTIVSYNDFMLPRLLWGAISTGSAG